MNRITLKEAKEAELMVCKYFNQYGVFVHCEDEFSPFDIEGYIQGKYYLIEVKKRRKIWDVIWFDYNKTIKLLELKKTQNVHKILLAVIKENDCYIYNVEEIAKQKVVKEKVNKRTAPEIAEKIQKVPKKLFAFPRTLNNKYINLCTKTF